MDYYCCGVQPILSGYSGVLTSCICAQLIVLGGASAVLGSNWGQLCERFTLRRMKTFKEHICKKQDGITSACSLVIMPGLLGFGVFVLTNSEQ